MGTWFLGLPAIMGFFRAHGFAEEALRQRHRPQRRRQTKPSASPKDSVELQILATDFPVAIHANGSPKVFRYDALLRHIRELERIRQAGRGGVLARYSARECPKCGGYLGIVIREPKDRVFARAINGLCVKCGYRLAWMSITGKETIPKSKPLVYRDR